jgi:hypothetical protein
VTRSMLTCAACGRGYERDRRPLFNEVRKKRPRLAVVVAINAAAEEPEPSTFRQAKVCGRQAEVCGRPACVAQIAKMLARVLRVGV